MPVSRNTWRSSADRLTRLNGGQPVDEKPLVASAPSWLTKDLMSCLQQQMESEATPLTDSLVLGSYFFGLDGFRFHILHLA